MSQKPELIAKLRVGSIVSGECSVCHEVIIVQDPGARMPDQLSNTLRQAFEEHVHQESRSGLWHQAHASGTIQPLFDRTI
jgi:hypothetical protein